MLRLVALEYNIGHPHPKGHWFLLATVIIFAIAVPALILVNLATLGFDLVPSFKDSYTTKEENLDVWWGNRRLPALLRPRHQACQPKELSRGDKFRLSGGLFDYTAMSVWQSNSTSQEPSRIEYTGQSFAHCSVNSVQFDYSLAEQTQTVNVGVFCESSESFKANVSMQTTIPFAWMLSKDFVGQYYGQGLEPEDLINADKNEYRRTVLSALQLISTDSLTIMRHSDKHLPVPLLSASIYFIVDSITGSFAPNTSTFAFVNGSTPIQLHPTLLIYFDATYNLMRLVIDAVHLDIGNHIYSNVFTNVSRLKETVVPNLAPSPISPTDWAEGSKPFYFSQLTTYQTWAQALLNGFLTTLGDVNLTLPSKSVMAIGYLCPTYRVKPTSSLLVSVFVGSATMILSVWSAWMFFSAFLARRIMPPKIICHCDDCNKRRAVEAQEAMNPPRRWTLAGFMARTRGSRRTPVPQYQDEEQEDRCQWPGIEGDRSPRTSKL
ncbi:unnamed protein product [Rhizoctonia solani]|uniref:Transmembrane protein n=1 Tax=Rhizoctonia solani TaxID=456999 RepID=A0A8H2WHA5_9AGAM|nr:unnamed protein product [Rhizoctonia solani]